MLLLLTTDVMGVAMVMMVVVIVTRYDFRCGRRVCGGRHGRWRDIRVRVEEFGRLNGEQVFFFDLVVNVLFLREAHRYLVGVMGKTFTAMRNCGRRRLLLMLKFFALMTLLLNVGLFFEAVALTTRNLSVLFH